MYLAIRKVYPYTKSTQYRYFYQNGIPMLHSFNMLMLLKTLRTFIFDVILGRFLQYLEDELANTLQNRDKIYT